MKRFVTTTLLLASMCFAAAAFAQSEPAMGQEPAGQEQGQRAGLERRGMPSPEEQLDRMSQRLNLTDDQKEKIKPILEDQAKQMQALRQDSSSSQDDRPMKFREIREKSMAQIRPILTSDQQKKMDEMMKQHHGRGGPRQEGSSPQ
jgi:periplasmic protein CpxP/Spy